MIDMVVLHLNFLIVWTLQSNFFIVWTLLLLFRNSSTPVLQTVTLLLGCPLSQHDDTETDIAVSNKIQVKAATPDVTAVITVVILLRGELDLSSTDSVDSEVSV